MLPVNINTFLHAIAIQLILHSLSLLITYSHCFTVLNGLVGDSFSFT